MASAPKPEPVLSIRRSRASDVTFIRALGTAAFAEYSATAGGDAVSMARRAITLVAERGGQSTGFVVVEPGSFATAYISAIAVLEEARGEGIGRALVRAAEQLARAEGAVQMALTTADSNVAALALFLRSGFRRGSSGAGRYPRGQRTVRLVKHLGRKAPDSKP